MFGLTGKTLSLGLITLFLLSGPILLPSRHQAQAADEASIKRRLDSMEENAKQQSWNSMGADIEIVEEQVKDIPEAARADILKRLEPLKKQYTALKAKEIHDNQLHMIRTQLDSAKELLGEKRPFSDDVDRAERMMDKYKDALTDAEKKDLAAEVAFLRRKSVEMNTASELERLGRKLDSAEKEFPEVQKSLTNPNGGPNGAANSLADHINQIVADLKKLPQDNPQVKEMSARANKLDTAFDAAANSGQRSKMLERAGSGWNDQKKEFAGWEAEKPATLGEFIRESNVNLPKTEQAIMKSRDWLDQDNTKEIVKSYGTDPQFKAIIDDATKTHDAATAKFTQAVEAVLTESEKNLSKDAHDHWQYYHSRLDYVMKGEPNHDKLLARIQGVITGWDNKVAANEKATGEAYNKAVAAADAAWPAMVAKVSASDGISPSDVLKDLPAYKGKVIRLKDARDRSSWELGGGWDFAQMVDGIPVAGHYSPGVSKAIHDSPELPSGTGFPQSHLDIIARIDGDCKVQESEYSQILQKYIPTYNHTGVKVTVIGFHGGAVSVIDGVGSAATGSGGSTVTSAGGGAVSLGASGWLMRIVWLLVGLGAAGVAVVKARPEMAAQRIAMAGPAGTNALSQVSRGVDMIGLVFAALGLVWLLMGLVYRDLLPALGVMACGLFAASDFLKTNGVPEATLGRIKPLGMMLAGVTAVLVVLHLFIGGLPLF